MPDNTQGAVDGGVENTNGATETKKVEQGGGEQQGVNVELEQLKNELSSRDKKIKELMPYQRKVEELEAVRDAEKMSAKTSEEQVKILSDKIDSMQRDSVLAEKLSNYGVSVEEAKKIISAPTAEEQAEALTNLLENFSGKRVESELDKFKAATVDATAKDKPKTSDNQDNALLEKLKQAASL